MKRAKKLAPKKSRHKPKICLNPSCKKEFQPGHYGDRQKVGSSADHIQVIGCPSCKGSGERRGDECLKCRGEGKVKQSCQEWYRIYWSQVRKPPSGIPPTEFARIELASRPDQLRHACLIAARESAMRKGELLGVTWGDIVGPDGKILPAFNLRGQWDDCEGFKATKTAGSRVAYFLPKAIEVLSKLPRGKPEDRVFPFAESGIYEWFVGLQRKLGIVKPESGYPYRWHEIRHTLLSELVHSGKGDEGLLTAKEIGGHKNIQTTLGYAVQSPAEIMKKAITLRGGSPFVGSRSITRNKPGGLR